MRIEFFHLRFPSSLRLGIQQFAAKLLQIGTGLCFESCLPPPSTKNISMPNTLTLGGAKVFNGNYLLTDGTSFNTSSGLAANVAPLTGAQIATITGTGVNSVAVDLGTGADTLLINTTLTGTAATAANSLMNLRGGNDSVIVNSNVTAYRIDGFGGNDTLVIGTATVANSLINGGIGADSILVNAGATLINTQISASTANNATDGIDTIAIAAGSTATGSFITNFSKANDVLIVGGSGPLSFAATSFTGTITRNTVGVNAFNVDLFNWLAQGTGNAIKLI